MVLQRPQATARSLHGSAVCMVQSGEEAEQVESGETRLSLLMSQDLA